MACVQLKNLFEDDKNYYGSIPETVEGILEKGDHYYLLADQTLHNDLLGKKHRACDLFETSLNTPEWGLRPDGKFSNFDGGLIELDDGSMTFPRLFLFDISEWLSEQPIEKLKEIADYAFWVWKRKEDEVTEENILPREDGLAGQLRDMKRQKTFFDKFPGKKT